MTRCRVCIAVTAAVAIVLALILPVKGQVGTNVAETTTGIDNHSVGALPHDKLREVLKKYNRLTQ